MQFNTVEEALEELRNGKIILVTDDRRGFHLRGRICNHRKHQLHGMLWQGLDLYAYV